MTGRIEEYPSPSRDHQKHSIFHLLRCMLQLLVFMAVIKISLWSFCEVQSWKVTWLFSVWLSTVECKNRTRKTDPLFTRLGALRRLKVFSSYSGILNFLNFNEIRNLLKKLNGLFPNQIRVEKSCKKLKFEVKKLKFPQKLANYRSNTGGKFQKTLPPPPFRAEPSVVRRSLKIFKSCSTICPWGKIRRTLCPRWFLDLLNFPLGCSLLYIFLKNKSSRVASGASCRR